MHVHIFVNVAFQWLITHRCTFYLHKRRNNEIEIAERRIVFKYLLATTMFFRAFCLFLVRDIGFHESTAVRGCGIS